MARARPRRPAGDRRLAGRRPPGEMEGHRIASIGGLSQSSSAATVRISLTRTSGIAEHAARRGPGGPRRRPPGRRGTRSAAHRQRSACGRAGNAEGVCATDRGDPAGACRPRRQASDRVQVSIGEPRPEQLRGRRWDSSVASRRAFKPHLVERRSAPVGEEADAVGRRDDLVEMVDEFGSARSSYTTWRIGMWARSRASRC